MHVHGDVNMAHIIGSHVTVTSVGQDFWITKTPWRPLVGGNNTLILAPEGSLELLGTTVAEAKDSFVKLEAALKAVEFNIGKAT